MCLFLLRQYRVRPSELLLAVLVLFVAGLVLKLFLFDLVGWHVLGVMRYDGAYSFREAALRLLDFAAIIAFLCAACYLLVGQGSVRATAIVFGTAALALLFVFTTLELNTFLYQYVPGLRAGGVSILWSLFALGLVIAGIWKDARAMRYAGLCLFAVVAWKVLLLDLARLEQLYRVIAFVLLGVLVLCGSLVYLKYRPVPSDAKKENEQ
jgi:uncharacterized membrane protein